MVFRPQHANGCASRIPNLLGAVEDHVFQTRITLCIHVSVANAVPLSRRSVVLNEVALVIRSRRTQEARNVER